MPGGRGGADLKIRPWHKTKPSFSTVRPVMKELITQNRTEQHKGPLRRRERESEREREREMEKKGERDGEKERVSKREIERERKSEKVRERQRER